MRLLQTTRRAPKARMKTTHRRRGAVMVMATGLMTVVMAFLAFSVDVGFIVLTKTQMKASTDAAALAAAQDLVPAFKPGSNATPEELRADAEDTAVLLASLHRSGEQSSAFMSGSRDVRVGQYHKDPATDEWVKVYDQWPYNFVETTIRRDQPGSDGTTTSPPDASLPLFFAPVIGHESADLWTRSTAAMMPGVGFRLPPGSSETIDILPIALDIETWEALLAGSGPDQWNYVESTGQIFSGSDGILEVDLYPTGTGLPSGNRGTVDIGPAGNSTNDLKRQILYGINASDLAALDFELRFDEPCVLNGDTGLSAGIKAQLEAIKGQPRAIPLFNHVAGPGNNAVYSIVKFVGVRILDVKLTGSPKQKHVTVQPCEFVSGHVVPGSGPVEVDSILTTPRLVD